MTTASKNGFDWHCEEHNTYGWRGDECPQCPKAPTTIESMQARITELEAAMAQSEPVAYTYEQIVDINSDKQGNWPKEYVSYSVFNKRSYGFKGEIPLYTHPQSQEAIERRVAEAVAKAGEVMRERCLHYVHSSDSRDEAIAHINYLPSITLEDLK